MIAIKRFSIALFTGVVLLTGGASAYVNDDTVPEVTDRVARISFVRGDVKIRRAGVEDWEKADANLPVVEGDEISTGSDGRVEIQFGVRTHLRADDNSFIQIRQLSDDGIAVSLSTGTATVRLKKFDKDKEFFEIDSPSTTVAVQKEGAFRIDAGDADSGEVRVSVTEGGEARVYSTNSGFSLRSGRSAKVFTAGEYAGEWETSDASRFADEFDSWSAERDDAISKRIASANYDSYYDQDIYGAEELNGNGSWEYTRDYGYVWRPYATAINVYRDWSPYRYGSWRWVPPFGWTWVNDEPWGWATYHHGRWIWYRGRWVWTPYGYYRQNRSWWYPALVVVQVVSRNICWYPLPYHYSYSDYNRGYHDWVGNRDHRRRPRNDDGRPPVTGGTGQNPPPVVQPPRGGMRPPPDRMPIEPDGGQIAGQRQPDVKPIESSVPPTGVISISADSFGVTRGFGSTPPPEVAKTILAKKNNIGSPSELPNYQIVRTRPGRDLTVQPPAIEVQAAASTRTGAGQRQRDVPLDRELMRSRVNGDRPPMPITPEVPIETGGREVPRRTGAVGRPVSPRRDIEPAPTERTGEPSVLVSPTKENPRYEAPPRRELPKPRDDDPPMRKQVPRQEDPAPRVEPQPRREPMPPRQDNPTPRVEQPRREPMPPRQENPAPRNDPPPRREAPPPAPKQDAPKPEPRPSQRIIERKKDPGGP